MSASEFWFCFLFLSSMAISQYWLSVMLMALYFIVRVEEKIKAD
jgi:hypothetical protein